MYTLYQVINYNYQSTILRTTQQKSISCDQREPMFDKRIPCITNIHVFDSYRFLSRLENC